MLVEEVEFFVFETRTCKTIAASHTIVEIPTVAAIYAILGEAQIMRILTPDTFVTALQLVSERTVHDIFRMIGIVAVVRVFGIFDAETEIAIFVPA